MEGMFSLLLRPFLMWEYTILPAEPNVIRTKSLQPFLSPAVCYVAVLAFRVLVSFIQKCAAPELATVALVLAIFA